MRIIIETIPHEQQRYDTVGDWQFIGNELIIRVSELRNFPQKPSLSSASTLVENLIISERLSFEFLVGIHELIEAILCKTFGVKEEEVDQWDMNHEDSKDPGSIPGCPYYRQHLIATIIERMLAAELDVDWNEYEEILEGL